MLRSGSRDKLFLGLECSSDMLSLGAVKGDKTVFSMAKLIDRGASQAPLFCRRLLDKHCLRLNDFEAVLVGAGPGSFTGLRIAYSMVKAWHCALGLPVKGRGSFDSIAEQVKDKAEKIAVITDARRNLIYAATYKVKEGTVIKETKEQLCSLEDFLPCSAGHMFVTYDLHIRDKALTLNKGLDFYPEKVWPLIMPLLKQMSMVYNRKSRVFIPGLEPLYIYPETCQVRNV